MTMDLKVCNFTIYHNFVESVDCKMWAQQANNMLRKTLMNRKCRSNYSKSLTFFLIYNINLLVSRIYCITRRHTAEGWKRMVVECFWEELNKIAKLMTSDIWGHFYFGASKPPYKPNYSFISRSPVFGKSSGRNLELWFTFSPVKWTNHSLA